MAESCENQPYVIATMALTNQKNKKLFFNISLFTVAFAITDALHRRLEL
jgi:hypothetical protein